MTFNWKKGENGSLLVSRKGVIIWIDVKLVLRIHLSEVYFVHGDAELTEFTIQHFINVSKILDLVYTTGRRRRRVD